MENYKNKTLPISDRVIDLINRMTLKEKVGQVNQHLYGWKTYEKNLTGQIKITEYLKKYVDQNGSVGALYGVLRADPWSKVDFKNGIDIYESHKVINKIQKYIIEHSRLGIPALFVEECPHGHQGLGGESYPTNIGKGNSFNQDLMQEMAAAQAEELRIKGVNVALVSTLDLAKDPRWGRTEECFGEDPYLSAMYSEAIVKGFQENLINDYEKFDNSVVNNKKTVGVVLKHFIAQGEVQGGHNSGTVNLGINDFNDTYQCLINSCRNAVGVMAAYNDIDGVPCHVNKHILQDKLRDDVGFQGIVMADGTALDRLTDFFPNDIDAIKAALEAGVDLSLWDNLYTRIEEAIKKYPNLIHLLNKSVYRVLSIKFALGIFDDPYTKVTKEEIGIAIKNNIDVNKRVALESITLLKNDGILPLKKEEKTIVIGPSADNIYNLLGDYTAPQSEYNQNKTLFNVLKTQMNNISYMKGVDIRDTTNSQETIKEAVNAAKKVDTIILVLGGSSARTFDMEFLNNGAVSSKGVNMDSGENVDLSSLKLGGDQLKLFNQIKRLDKKIITILIEGRPHEINTLMQESNAVLVAWYPGIEGATAITDILIGKYNPNGKLSLSYPISTGQLPVYYYQRDAAKNENYYDISGLPALNFGYGLHYSHVIVDEIQVSLNKLVVILNTSLKIPTFLAKWGQLMLMVFSNKVSVLVLSILLLTTVKVSDLHHLLT